ncbi:MAG: cyanophycin synthetase, partial [Anaerolineales bacterium]
EIIHGLQESQAQLRLVAVRAENGALILDDTYNAAPESSLAALNLLGEISGRRVAVLGDMLELGQYEREGHERVGARAAEVADVLVTFGVRAHLIAESARRAGLKRTAVQEFEDLDEMIAWLDKNLTGDDVVLFKGSNSMRLDRAVSALEVTQ